VAAPKAATERRAEWMLEKDFIVSQLVDVIA
jgi:hypothetical protein